MSTKLSIIIVNYNSTADLLRCLSSIRSTEEEDQLQVVVVDNASADQSSLENELRSFSSELLLNQENEGFARACNRGIRHCEASFFLLLNPDVIVHHRAIGRTLDYLRTRPGTGVTGCRILNPNGSLQLACRRSIPTVRNSLYRFLGLSRLFPESREFGAYNLTCLDEHETQPVEAVSGSFLMFRRELIEKIGLLDEQFFLYGEDLDFCYRALQAGWLVEYYADATVTHLKSRSADQDTAVNTRHFYNAMKIFYAKHYAPTANPLRNRLVRAGIELAHVARRTRQTLGGGGRVGSRR